MITSSNLVYYVISISFDVFLLCECSSPKDTFTCINFPILINVYFENSGRLLEIFSKLLIYIIFIINNIMEFILNVMNYFEKKEFMEKFKAYACGYYILSSYHEHKPLLSLVILVFVTKPKIRVHGTLSRIPQQVFEQSTIMVIKMLKVITPKTRTKVHPLTIYK